MRKVDKHISISKELNDRVLLSCKENNRKYSEEVSYLISKERVEFIATIPANNKGGVAHSKYGIFTDESNNKVVFNGSANFSKNSKRSSGTTTTPTFGSIVANG